MGEMKLIKGAFNGKVGEFYGTKQFRKYYVKSVPFSHAPHNALQNQAFSAFGCLQRMSSQFAKSFWNYLGLSNRNMNKINAVAHFLKPVISDRIFRVGKIVNVIPGGNELMINDFSFSKENQMFVIDYSLNIDTSDKRDLKICYAFIAENGAGQGGGTFYGQSGKISLPTTWTETQNLSLVFFLSYLEKNKRILCSCSCEELKRSVFSNYGWYPNNMKNGDWYFSNDGGVVSENAVCEFKENGLFV